MIANNITRIMHERNLTQTRLAELSNISQPALSAILRGTSNPKDNTLAAIATALGTEVQELLRDDVFEDGKITCPKCGSSAIMDWTNHGNGHCRLRCGFCEADTGEQNSRALALRIFNSFRPSPQSPADSVRVMSLVELLDSVFFDSDDVRPVWFENRGLFIVPALLQYGLAERERENVRVEWCGTYSMKSYELKQYGSWWRCWTGKPTEAQSEAAPWVSE